MSEWTDVKDWATTAAVGPYGYGVGQRVLALIAENARLAALLECSQGDMRTADKIIAERSRLLSAIPECPVHGPCVPHAIEWVEKIILVAKGLTAECAELRKDADRYQWVVDNPVQARTYLITELGQGIYAKNKVWEINRDIDEAMGNGEQS